MHSLSYCCTQGTCRATSFTSCCPLGGASVMRRQQALRLRRVAVRAEVEEQKSSGGTDALFASGSGKVEGALTYGRDAETFEDVFAFAGELPEVTLVSTARRTECAVQHITSRCRLCRTMHRADCRGSTSAAHNALRLTCGSA
jgi:hypothetical protein